MGYMFEKCSNLSQLYQLMYQVCIQNDTINVSSVYSKCQKLIPQEQAPISIHKF